MSGCCRSSMYSRYLYQLSTVFPSVIFHSTPGAFVVRFSLGDNFLIDAFVGFCPHRLLNLSPRWHRPFFLYPSFPSLLCFIVRLFFSGVLLLYSFCGAVGFESSNFLFHPVLRRMDLSLQTLSFPKIFFRSADGPDCFQPFSISDILW